MFGDRALPATRRGRVRHNGRRRLPAQHARAWLVDVRAVLLAAASLPARIESTTAMDIGRYLTARGIGLGLACNTYIIAVNALLELTAAQPITIGCDTGMNPNRSFIESHHIT